MDVLFDNELCNLIYMRDITGIVERNAPNLTSLGGPTSVQ